MQTHSSIKGMKKYYNNKETNCDLGVSQSKTNKKLQYSVKVHRYSKIVLRENVIYKRTNIKNDSKEARKYLTQKRAKERTKIKSAERPKKRKICDSGKNYLPYKQHKCP